MGNGCAEFPVGTKFNGRVTNITDYGAFVELLPGIEGLVHVSEMSWTKKNVHPGKIVSTSQEVEVCHPRRRHLQASDFPWSQADHAEPMGSVPGQQPCGTEVEGEIRNITEFGLFVGLEGDIDGMVHLSDHRLEPCGRRSRQGLHQGRIVSAKVLDVDVEKERISLGIKQLEDDPFANAMDGLKRGQVVTTVITQVQDNGIEVQVTDGVTGFIRRSDLARDRDDQRTDRFAVGEKVDAKITAIDSKTRKISLSIKARETEEEQEAMAEYGSTDSGASLGDILGEALKKGRNSYTESKAHSHDRGPARGLCRESATC